MFQIRGALLLDPSLQHFFAANLIHGGFTALGFRVQGFPDFGVSV